MMVEGEEVKENVWGGRSGGGGLGARGCCSLLAAALALALLATTCNDQLPEALTEDDLATNPESFNAALAHKFLVNLTSIGPRVAGSYECDVAGAGVAAAALRAAAAGAGPHNTLDIDLHRSDGFFNLTFFDGMNNAYRGVVSVVGRVRARGAAPSEPALLINCHIDTVPDSPGASDDGAGCAVVAEAGRALAAAPLPLPRPVLLLFNAAEETIMQGSHSFVSTHPWARRVRAFVNVEACGAGGREVVFQAGAGWVVSAYRRAAPHPFASSLAQELFHSGLIPADTDYRVFRDFARIPGLDLAWQVDGYVYHTGLDTASRVPPPVLQRTGDNIRALAHVVIRDPMLSGWGQLEDDSGPPVYFDVLGQVLVCLPPRSAAALALGLLALLVFRLKLHAKYAANQLAVSGGWWWGVCGGAARRCGAAAAGGVAVPAALALLLHCAGAAMPYYTHTALLLPLYMLPALLASGYLLRRGLFEQKEWVMVAARERAWWAAWCLQAGGAIANGVALAVCLVLRLRSGFLPATWLAADTAAQLLPLGGAGVRRRVWLGAAGGAAAALQNMYMALAWMRTLVPLAARAGDPPLPPDVVVAAASGVVAVSSWWWCAPLLATAARPRALAAPALALALLAAVWSMYASYLVDGWPYSETTPQRMMVFHVSSTEHVTGRPPLTNNYYWVPRLDSNTEHTLRKYVAGVYRENASTCGWRVYCGSPYYLPVRSLVRTALRAPAPHAPLPQLDVRAALTPDTDTTATLTLHINGTGVTQTVVIVSLPGDARVALADVGVPPAAPPLPAAHSAHNTVYFFSLSDPNSHPWNVKLYIQHSAGRGPVAGGGGWWGQVAVAGHALHGPRRLHPHHRGLLRGLPPHTAATGWGVRMHLLQLQAS